jgi:hypothetical protein
VSIFNVRSYILGNMLLEKIHFEDSEAVSADERGSVGG